MLALDKKEDRRIYTAAIIHVATRGNCPVKARWRLKIIL
jgi:hypothetical protein